MFAPMEYCPVRMKRLRCLPIASSSQGNLLMNVYFYRNGYFYSVETIISVGVLPLEKSASGKQGP